MARADDGGVDRLVVVLLRRRDVVLEAARHRAPGRMHDAERAIAGIDVAHDDAEAVDVGELLERDLAVLHLAPDRERLLLAAVDLGFEAGFGELARAIRADLLDQPRVAARGFGELVHDRLVGLRMQPHLKASASSSSRMRLHAHAPGQRRIDLQRLLADAPPALRLHVLQRAHVVQPVGELDRAARGCRWRWRPAACGSSRPARPSW